MTIYFSPSTNGFYTEKVHGNGIPSDRVLVTEADYKALMDAQSKGKRIVASASGQPQSVDNIISSEEAWEQAKDERAGQVENIVVTTASGNMFDGDEESQNRMTRAVVAGNPGETTEWKLADNTKAVVSVEELKEALRLAGQEQTRIWMSYTAE